MTAPLPRRQRILSLRRRPGPRGRVTRRVSTAVRLVAALTLVGGLIAFIYVLLRSTMGRFTPAQATATIVVSYYWHFVDIVWIGLFSVIYLIR